MPSQRKGRVHHQGVSLKSKAKFSGGHPASSAPLGSGGRSKALAKKLRKQGGVKDVGALVGSIARKKYGNKRAARLSAKGRHRAAVRRHGGKK
jgi:hypothetical protein